MPPDPPDDRFHAATQAEPRAEPLAMQDLSPGTIIGGRYKLLENIGEGGMGAVWAAEQRPVKRRVALKLIKPGMDSPQVLARFEAERQALALMDHPNIAKVFDGGTTEQGRPYFVMEHVKGIPITEYCDQARLPVRDRLALFIPVCHAVQHAHHKGIVHRDLKPSNILICLFDGRPVPKVIDFGLAKALHQPLTEQSIYTSHGAMVGTPLYVSPEQAEYNNLDVDTRSDIYSLGVVLYELLTGSTPLEREQLRSAAYNEVLRLIKEVEPPRPSLRLSGSTQLARIAAQRSIDPRQLCKSLSGDVDWIVIKALEKERSRRYETANSFARDIERALNEEPVEAGPPSRTYRLRKLLWKHRGKVTAAAALVAVLVLGIIGTTWGLLRSLDAEGAASKSEKDAIAALGQATHERNAKEGALAEVSRQRDVAERHLAAGFTQHLGYDREYLERSELKSLADWSALDDSALQVRILELALQDSDLSLRLAARAAHVIQGCVGVSPRRRAEVIEIVTARQRDKDADPRIRVAACWLAMELASNDLPALEESIQYLADPEHKTARDMLDATLVFRLPEEHVVRAWDALMPVLDGYPAETGFATLAAALAPERVARGWDDLIAVLMRSSRSKYAVNVGEGLTNLALRLEPARVAPGGEALIAVLETSKNPFAVRAAGQGFVSLAPRLPPEQVTRGWDAFLLVLKDAWDPAARDAAGQGLAALATVLPEKDLPRAETTLIALLDSPKTSQAFFRTTGALGAVGSRLPPQGQQEQALRGWETLMGLLERTSYRDLQDLERGLSGLAPRLPPEQLAPACERLIAALEKLKSVSVSYVAAGAMADLAARMPEADAARTWGSLIDNLEKQKSLGESDVKVRALFAFESRLPVEAATRVWDASISLHRLKDQSLDFVVEQGLVSLASRLPEVQVAIRGEALVLLLENPTTDADIRAAADGLGALASRLPREQVERAGEALIGMLQTKLRGRAMEGLADLAPQLSTEQFARAWDALDAMQDLSNRDEVSLRVETMGGLVPCLRRKQAARFAESMIEVLGDSSDKEELYLAAGLLADLAAQGRLPQPQFERSWDALLEVVEKAADVDARCAAVEAMSQLAMSPFSALDRARRVRGAEVLIGCLETIDAADQLGEVLQVLPTADQPRIALKAATAILDGAATSENFLVRDRPSSSLYGLSSPFFGLEMAVDFSSSVSHAASEISNPRSVARLLSHPGCVGKPREYLLQRFEELVFHGGRPVFLTPGPLHKPPWVESMESLVPAFVRQAAAALEPKTPPPARRFRNLHDAAAWIAKHLPDVDLEKNHPLMGRAPL